MDTVTPVSKKLSKKDDHLWLLRLLFVDLYQNSLIKITSKFLALNLAVLMVIQTILFLQKFDSSYFIKYLAFYGASFFYVAALYTVPRISEICQECVNGNFTIWTLKTAKLTTKRRIYCEVILTNIAVVVIRVVGIAVGVTQLKPLENDADLYFPLALFEEFLPQWKTFLSWGFRINFLLTAFLAPAVFYILIYFTTFLRLQLYLLIDFLETVGNGYDPKQEQYHRTIREKLRIGVERHVYLWGVISEFQAKFKSFIFVLNIAGAILGISLLVFAFSGTFQGHYPRIISIGLSYFFTLCHTILSGQLLEHVSDEVLQTLKRTNWYDWDRNNKKSYLIFLTNQRTFRINFSQFMAVNYEMGVGIMKSIYSAVSVMRRLRQLDYSQ